MKYFCGLIALIVVGIVAWRIGEALSSDAISMAVGVLFGVLAGIPTALLVLVGGRRPQPIPTARSQPPAPPPAPTIVVNSTTQHVNHNYRMIPPTVQRGMMERGGDEVIKTHDGKWLILRDQAIVGTMSPRCG